MNSTASTELMTSFAPMKKIGANRIVGTANREPADAALIQLRGSDLDPTPKTSATDANCGNEDRKRPLASFDLVVKDVDDLKAASEVTAAAIECAQVQIATISPELAAMVQNIQTIDSSASSTDVKTFDNTRQVVSPSQDDMLRFAEQLSSRVAALNRLPIPAKETIDRGAFDNGVLADGAAAVSVSTLQDKTGVDAPIRVKLNQQTWFQAVAASAGPLATPMLRAEAKLSTAVASGIEKPAAEPAIAARAVASADELPELAQRFGDQKSAQHSDGDSDHSRPAIEKRSISSDALISSPKASAAVSDVQLHSMDSAPGAPYQQIRAAVGEVIVSANGTQQTDYVSLYADRPTSSNLTLKTLELSLEPPDLGRVNIKLNLTSRDLKLEIEATKASTAQMLSSDQAALKRELLSENSELSSVLVSVTSAVSDASAARGTASGEQQFASHSRAASDNAFASSTSSGGNDQKHRHQSGHEENGVAGRQRDGNPEAVNARPSAEGLYI